MTLTIALMLAAAGLTFVSLGFVRVNEPDPAPAADCAPPCVPLSQYQAEHRLAVRRLKGWRRSARRVVSLKRALLKQPSVSEAINLACTVYGHCAELWRKARCESHLYTGAHNASGASGLFQFLPSTWASTPYGRFSVWSGYANALAAGWMHANGRGGEWACQ